MKISVVIPVYNEEDYVKKCIDSLLKQTKKPFEIILIDDGSTDNSVKIIESYKEKKVILWKQERGGPGRARNLGARKAKGDILVLVDADMKFDKKYIKELTKPIIDGEVKATAHGVEEVANKEKIWARCWGTKRIKRKKDEFKKGGVMRAVLRKAFLKGGGFKPSKGYFDDAGLPLLVKRVYTAKCYHHNPTNLDEVYRQSKWIAGSIFKNKGLVTKYFTKAIPGIIILAGILGTEIFYQFNIIHILSTFFIALPLFGIILLTLTRTINDRDLTYLYALPVFYTVRLFAIISGILEQLVSLGQGYKY